MSKAHIGSLCNKRQYAKVYKFQVPYILCLQTIVIQNFLPFSIDLINSRIALYFYGGETLVKFPSIKQVAQVLKQTIRSQ